MSTDPLSAVFAPRAVMVVGASTDPTKLGGAMAATLTGVGAADGGPPVLLVNSRGGAGMHSSVTDAVAAASTPVDLAVLCVPAAACADVVAECGTSGVGAALVCAGGFAEVGDEGLEHERRLVEAARAHGVRLVGPNTSGFFVPGSSLRASFVPGVGRIRAGGVGLVAASGGLNHALAFALERQGVGLSLGIGIGAGVDVAAPEVLRHLRDDDATRSVVLHVESVADGPALLDAVRDLAEVKPVVALVVGQYDVGDFARSHTGALATSWRTTRALLRQAGAVVVDDEDALLAAGSVLAEVRMPLDRAPGVGLVTAQAGPGLLVADALHDAEVALPPLSEATRARLGELLPPMTYQTNPVDTGRPAATHDRVLSAVAADRAIDLVAAYALTEPVVDLPASVAAADLDGVPVVVGLDGPADQVAAARRSAAAHGVAAVVGARALSVAVSALVADARARLAHADDVRREGEGEGEGDAARRPAPRLDAGPLAERYTEARAKDVLDRLGIATPPRAVCATPEAAGEAFDTIGGPVAIKISDAAIVHKSDAGGVRLGVVSHDDAVRVAGELLATGVDEVLVERMAPSGLDLVLGARRDPVFGPVLLLGLGGVTAEVDPDVAILGLPASTGRLRALPDDLRAHALLDGFRGGPVLDRDALAEVARGLSDLLLANPDLTDVEINPLRLHAGGLVALDAVLETHTTHPEEHP